MIALWEKPHHLLVKDEPSQIGGRHEFRAQTSTKGCSCKEVIAALILGGLELEFNLGNNLLVKNSAPTATFKLHSMDVKFCPFCGKSAKLLAPRTQWISKDGEKTRL